MTPEKKKEEVSRPEPVQADIDAAEAAAEEKSLREKVFEAGERVGRAREALAKAREKELDAKREAGLLK